MHERPTEQGHEVLPPFIPPQRLLGDMYSLGWDDLAPLAPEVAAFLDQDVGQGVARLSQRQLTIMARRFSLLQEDGSGDLQTHKDIGLLETPAVSGNRIRTILKGVYRVIRGPNEPDFRRYAFLALA